MCVCGGGVGGVGIRRMNDCALVCSEAMIVHLCAQRRCFTLFYSVFTLSLLSDLCSLNFTSLTLNRSVI